MIEPRGSLFAPFLIKDGPMHQRPVRAQHGDHVIHALIAVGVWVDSPRSRRARRRQHRVEERIGDVAALARQLDEQRGRLDTVVADSLPIERLDARVQFG